LRYHSAEPFQSRLEQFGRLWIAHHEHTDGVGALVWKQKGFAGLANAESSEKQKAQADNQYME
jgi:hypothetical protein